MKESTTTVKISIVILMTILSCGTTKVETLEHKSDKEADNNNIKNALLHINDAIEIDSTIPRLFLKRALYLSELNENAEAIHSIDVAIKLSKTDYLLYSEKANILTEINQIDSAIVFFEKAIQLSPLQPSIYYNRGKMFKTIGQPEKAVKDYDWAISLDSVYFNAYYSRGRLECMSFRDYYTAIQDFSYVIKNFKPSNLTDRAFLGSIYLLRGTCYDLSGNLDNACSDFKKAKELGLNEADNLIDDKCLNK
jgi:tetratricopeptide (TPR) repeat protein